MASEEKSKKRSWGKTKFRGKGSPMELIAAVADPNAQVKTSQPAHSKIDFQHPELLSTDSLVDVLSDIKVPIPVYSDGKPSRERLLYLFRKHVTPQPQRTKVGRSRFWRKALNAEQNGTHVTHKVDEMDIDNNDQDWTSTERSTVTCITSPFQRKRTLEGADTPSTPNKKPSLEIPCTPLSRISMNDSISPSSVEKTPTLSSPLSGLYPLPSTQPRLIKLKRPIKSAMTNSESSAVSDSSSYTKQSDGLQVVDEKLVSPQTGRITWP